MQNHFREAVELYKKKDFVAAREKFDSILAVYPGHIPSQKYLKKIIEAYGEIDDYSADLITNYLKKANKALDKGDIIEARENFNRVLSKEPDNISARNGMDKIENYNREIFLEKQREKNRKQIEYLWKRSQKFYKHRDFVHSKESLNFILDIDPENKAAKAEMVKVDGQLSKIASSEIAQLYSQGVTLFNEGEFEESIKYFEAVMVANPQRKDVRDFIGKAKKAKQQEIDEKIASAQNKVHLQMEEIFKQALNYYNKNNFENAVKYFKKSKEFADKYKFVEYSKESSNYILKIYKRLSEIHYKKGFEFYRKNNFNKALEEYKIALNYDPNNTSASFEYKIISDDIAQKYYEDGMAFYSKGEFSKAEELLRKALIYSPNKIEAKRALEKIR
jgi:tetratricopeptide (TPR) repeat protein